MMKVLGKFSKTLNNLDRQYKNFHLIDSQNMGLEGYLVDEIHLNHTGYMKLAFAIMEKLDKVT